MNTRAYVKHCSVVLSVVWATWPAGCGTFDPSQCDSRTSRVAPDGSAIGPCPNGKMTADPSISNLAASDVPYACCPQNPYEPDASCPPFPRFPHNRRHVILIIGDGMGYAHQVAASRYRYGIDRGLSFHSFPVQALVTTWSTTAYDTHATSSGAPLFSKLTYDPILGYDPVLGGYAPYPMLPDPPGAKDYFLATAETASYTDSAAAATAMATGVKTRNGILALDPDGLPLETSLERLQRVYHMATGLVTTVPFSDATPAGFASHVPNRSDFSEIAHQMLTVTRPNVVIGAGLPGTTDTPRISDADHEELRASTDYVYVERADDKHGGEELLKAAATAVQQNRKLWGTFGKDEYGFEPPTAIHSPGNPTLQRNSDRDPTLPLAAIAALDVLSRNDAGFFLMIEQGAIDKFSHSADYATMVGCVWELDDTVKAVLDYVARPDDDVDWSNTTIFVMADHETNFLRFSDAAMGIGQLAEGTASFAWGVGDHTNQLIALSATGAYAHRVHAYTNVYPGRPILDNTSIYRLTMDASER